jgi:hypothetical protein
MNANRRAGLMTALVLTLAPTWALSAGQKELEELMSHDGLQKISVKGIDLAFARPGATLAGYSRIKLDPIEVAFRKDWDPERTGSRIKLSTAEREEIRTGVATIVKDAFVKELQEKSSYKVVSESGPDVLRVRVHIANLYVNAPDTMSAGRSRTYSVTAGEMTLYQELYDSETGEILARLVDREEGRNAGQMQLSSGVMNRGEAQDIATAWARILRTALDRAHGVGKK